MDSEQWRSAMLQKECCQICSTEQHEGDDALRQTIFARMAGNTRHLQGDDDHSDAILGQQTLCPHGGELHALAGGEYSFTRGLFLLWSQGSPKLVEDQ